MRNTLMIILTVFLAASVFADAPTMEGIEISEIVEGYTKIAMPEITIITPGGDPTEMQLSCDGDNWKAWQPIVNPVIDFDITSSDYGCLDDADGSITVHLKLKNIDGEAGPETDDTYYDTTAPTGSSFSDPLETDWFNENTDDPYTTITCGNADDGAGSGIASYTIDQSFDNSVWIPVCTAETNGICEWDWDNSGASDQVNWYFRCKATDNLGHKEETYSTLTMAGIDTTDPINTSIEFDDGESTKDISPEMSLNAEDELSDMDEGEMKFKCDDFLGDPEWSDAINYADSHDDFDLVSGEYGCAEDDGFKKVYVQFSDAAGNWATASNSIDLNWLPVNNSITVTEATSDSTPELTFDYGGDCENILLSCDKTNWFSVGSCTNAINQGSDEDFYINTETYGCTTGDGTKTIYSVVKDEEGNESVIRDASTSYDTTAPTGSITNDYTSNYTNNDTPQFELTSDGTGSNVIEMQFSCDNSAWTSGVNYSSLYSNFDIDSSNNGCSTGDGTKDVYVKFKDAAGNKSTATIKTGVKYDNSNPSTPTLDTASASNEEVYLDWDSVSDDGPAGIKEYKIYKNGSHTRTTSNTEYTITGLNNGTEYYFEIQAVDNAGNDSSYSNKKYATPTAGSNNNNNNNNDTCGDTTKPTLSWVFPKDGQKFNKGIIELKVSATDNGTMGGVRFYNEMRYIGSTTSPSSGNNWTYEWDASEKELGDYPIRAMARDSCGNITNKTITITLTDEEILDDTIDLEDEDTGEETEKTYKEQAEKIISDFETYGIEIPAMMNALWEDGLSETEMENAEKRFKRIVDDYKISVYKTQNYETDKTAKTAFFDSAITDDTIKQDAKEVSENWFVLRQLKIVSVTTPEGTEYYAVIVIYITNSGNEEMELQIVETVPKEFAETASLLGSALEFEVLNEDPIVVFKVNAPIEGTVSVGYRLQESITQEAADAMIENNIVQKFSGIPIVLSAATEIESSNFVENTNNEISTSTMFANLLSSEYIMLGLGLLILAAVALFIVNYMRSGREDSDEGFSDSFGLGAAYRKADNGGFESSRSRHSEFLSDLAGKIRQNKTEDKNNRWAYKD